MRKAIKLPGGGHAFVSTPKKRVKGRTHRYAVAMHPKFGDLIVRTPLPAFTEAALRATCPYCGAGGRPPEPQTHRPSCHEDPIQHKPFLVVSCWRCGGPIERYGPVRP